jgi:hypothetical protein
MLAANAVSQAKGATDQERTAERAAIVRWTARMGAVTADAVAGRRGSSVASARGRLGAAERDGQLASHRPLTGAPALYTVTRAGLRSCGLHGLGPCRVSASNALHLAVCAEVAAALELRYPDHRVLGERELRRDERELGAALASACLLGGPAGGRLLHRPDLALCPSSGDGGLPVAVEVELTVKSPRRLAEICRAWLRCRCVAGVLYVATPEVERALQRALEKERAGDRIVVLALSALSRSGEAARTSAARTVAVDS